MKKHTGSGCHRCKDTIFHVLEKIYGKVENRYRTKEVSVRPEDYFGTKYFKELNAIFNAMSRLAKVDILGKNRKHLHQSDLFIPKPGILVETDEDQHFTLARLRTLEMYPRSLKTGFDREMYMSICTELHRVDTNPPHRDPQRAWYDTVRDFMYVVNPEIRKPTVRIIIRQHEWCTLDSESKEHIRQFRKWAEI
jgi:hypothetical protein